MSVSTFEYCFIQRMLQMLIAEITNVSADKGLAAFHNSSKKFLKNTGKMPQTTGTTHTMFIGCKSKKRHAYPKQFSPNRF